jgi:hypothetical protein
VSFYISHGIKMLSEACDPDAMPEGVREKYANDEVMQGIRDRQRFLYDLATISNGHRRLHGPEAGKYVASIPVPALQLAIANEPDLLLDKDKFWRWYRGTKYAAKEG